ncbi:MAG: DNA polymerase III subunit beta [Deltaproteobacteria bacterium]|nr:DNA polymerase III subunit beta [Deltaproteobacteria bacterium]
MKFIVEKAFFQTSLGKIQGIAERRSTIPILSNILISGEKNRLNIVATDLEIGVKESIEANIMEKGDICIPAKKLYDAVRELSEEKVEIQREGNFWISIKAGKTIFSLPGVDPDEFPKFPDTEGANYFNLRTSDLLGMVEKTVFAASTEESRFNLNGIYMEKVKEENREFLRMVATDGHRLSKIDKEVESTLDKGVIIPRRGLIELRRILGEEEEEVAISIKDNNCIFKTNRNTVVVRLLEGEYPDYQQVIPTANDKLILVNKKEFMGSLRRAQVIASEKGEGVRFSIKGGLMEINTGGPDVGSVQEEIKIDYEGDPLEISFNARYLLDVLNIMDADEVRVELKEELIAGVIRPVDGEAFLYVIMPMRP